MSVLIVGAGPSGARLAIQLARAGVEVTLGLHAGRNAKLVLTLTRTLTSPLTLLTLTPSLQATTYRTAGIGV